MTKFTKAPLPQAAFIIGLLFASRFCFLKFGPTLIWNFTESTPKGIYQLSPLRGIERDKFVALPPPKQAIQVASGRPWFRPHQMIIKQVAALENDLVCTSGGALSINGKHFGPVFETDKQGIPLPHHNGCYLVPPDTAFLIGPDSPWTFDSRYFGPVSTGLIPFTAKHLLTSPF